MKTVNRNYCTFLFLEYDDTSSTSHITMADKHRGQPLSKPSRCLLGGVLVFATIGIVAWMAVISAIVITASSGESTVPPGKNVSLGLNVIKFIIKEIKELKSRIQDLEYDARQAASLASESGRPLEEIRPSFAAVRMGDITNGKITYNDKLYAYPFDAFSTSEGTFTAPVSGAYSFSFSGTSFCSENWVEAQVNNETTLKYYDRDSSWSGPNNTTNAYFRGWTQQFALQLEVEDEVRLLVDCDSDESFWKNHQPNTIKEHHGHACFYGKANFYFFGQYMG